MTRHLAPKSPSDSRLTRILVAVVALLGSASTAIAQDSQQPGSERETSRPRTERDTTRQTVRPGQPPSSRREPSRIRNGNEPPPTVQNRAPDVMIPAPPTPPPAQGNTGN